MIDDHSNNDSFQPGYVGRYDWVLANEVYLKTPQCFEKSFYYVHGLLARSPPELSLSTTALSLYLVGNLLMS